MSKQSSVEWLKDQLEHFGNKHELTVSWATIDDLIEQAKAMHKEEVIESYCQGCLDISNDDTIFPRETSEQYYKETFGGK